MKKANYKIYALIDPITKQIKYIGQTRRELRVRLNGHVADKRTSYKASWIQSLWEKKKIRPEIILIDECCDLYTCNDLEIFWISYFKYIGCKLTNLSSGGLGPTGVKISEENKIKNSIRHRGRKKSESEIEKIKAYQNNRTEDHKMKLSKFHKSEKNVNTFREIALNFIKNVSHEEKSKMSKKGWIKRKGKPISEETRKKISQSRIGVKRPAWIVEKVRASNTGKKRTEEHKKRMSEIKKGTKMSEETKLKMSLSHKGKVFSESHRENLSKASKGKKKSNN